MAIIIPTAYSTYGDASTTEGGPLNKYVLAQFRSDADLGWVGRIRSTCTLDELKWSAFRQHRARLRQIPDLWSEIENGMGLATVIVIDPVPLSEAVRRKFCSDGAVEGHDFGIDEIVQGCASAVVANTPIAYLPNELARSLGWYSQDLYLSFDKFTPEAIQKKIGVGLRDAKVFAARAHATFDVPSVQNTGGAIQDAFRSPASPLVVAELLSTGRAFDQEHEASVKFLNESVEVIAQHLEEAIPISGVLSDQPLITEVDSRAIDHIQGADIAAGWARELLDLGDERALARRFQRVLVNGRPVPV